jgi:hypothetical protein
MAPIASESVTSSPSLASHPFLQAAAAAGLFGPDVAGFTIFLPCAYGATIKRVEVDRDALEEAWNHHVARGVVRIGRSGIVQVSTLSTLIVSVYATGEGDVLAAGVPLCPVAMNTMLHGCCIHPLKAPSLPCLRPIPTVVQAMRCMYLAGEAIDVTFEGLGTETPEDSGSLYLTSSFHARDERPDVQTCTSWVGNGTNVEVHLPSVATRTQLFLVFQLHDASDDMPVLAMPWPIALDVAPNAEMRPSFVITAVVPSRGSKGDELVILGRNFSPTDVRVCIGPKESAKVACVFHSSDSLIRCLVPEGIGRQPVWVMNGNVYARYDFFQFLEGAASDICTLPVPNKSRVSSDVELRGKIEKGATKKPAKAKPMKTAAGAAMTAFVRPNATKANATKANATKANATKANATKANATKANATKANATKANATKANEGIMKVGNVNAAETNAARPIPADGATPCAR